MLTVMQIYSDLSVHRLSQEEMKSRLFIESSVENAADVHRLILIIVSMNVLFFRFQMQNKILENLIHIDLIVSLDSLSVDHKSIEKKNIFLFLQKNRFFKSHSHLGIIVEFSKLIDFLITHLQSQEQDSLGLVIL